jgi:pimeloyl-ACP methyl ester carboxylesterase
MNSQADVRKVFSMNRRTFVSMVAVGAAGTFIRGTPAAAESAPKARNVVLVHGLFADGSSWSEVIARLQKAGLNATSVQNPLTTLPEAVASAERVLARQDGPTVLVGHSFSGMIVTEAGMHPERVGSCLCGGSSAGCGRGLRGVGQDISDATGVRRDCLRRR